MGTQVSGLDIGVALTCNNKPEFRSDCNYATAAYGIDRQI